jgi:ATP-dependent RNA helicase DeaD
LKFEELAVNEKIVRSLEELGFSEPFPIQVAAIGPLLDGRDIIGQAKTGTGKTAAFGIPMLQHVDVDKDAVQGLVLAPTRELAQQVASDLNHYGKYMGVKVLAVYGGVPVYDQMEALQHIVHIIVGTPGRVIDLVNRGVLLINQASFVVLDEGDRMLDMGFIDDIEYVLSRTAEPRQTAMFSATMPEEILALAGRHMRYPEKLLISQDEIAVEEIVQFYIPVDFRRKFQELLSLIEKKEVTRALVFCATKIGADELGHKLMRVRRDVAVIHGDLTQEQRDRSLASFRAGKVRFLIATDVASRGLDIDGISHVINYDVPAEPLQYFHRIGRTGRAGARGTAVTLVTQHEMADIHRIQQLTQQPLRRLNADSRSPTTPKLTVP